MVFWPVSTSILLKVNTRTKPESYLKWTEHKAHWYRFLWRILHYFKKCFNKTHRVCYAVNCMVNFLTRNWPMRWDKLWKHCVLRDFHLSIKIEQSSLIAFKENLTEWWVLLWKTFKTWNEWSASFISWGSVIVIQRRKEAKC